MNETQRTHSASDCYLYGVVLGDGELPEADQPLQLISHAGLVAIVAPVPLADYEPDALRARLRDAAWLEAAVRRHHDVVARIFAHRPILPAKFGCVYPSADDVRQALQRTRQDLLDRLASLADSDEWSVHLYATPELARAAVPDADTDRLERELAGASAGRAYLLRRKVEAAQAEAIDHAFDALARSAHDRLAALAVASALGEWERRPPGASDEEVEILRAAYLVRRPGLAQFLAELEELARSLHAEWSGPWPPYSFAAAKPEAQ